MVKESLRLARHVLILKRTTCLYVPFVSSNQIFITNSALSTAVKHPHLHSPRANKRRHWSSCPVKNSKLQSDEVRTRFSYEYNFNFISFR